MGSNLKGIAPLHVTLQAFTHEYQAKSAQRNLFTPRQPQKRLSKSQFGGTCPSGIPRKGSRFLFDTKIFLEILLDQAKAKECHPALETVDRDRDG